MHSECVTSYIWNYIFMIETNFKTNFLQYQLYGEGAHEGGALIRITMVCQLLEHQGCGQIRLHL